jgi:U3 small nucleolar RNA-associated protein 20
MRWFAAMVSHLPNEDNERFLVHILTPVYHLLEDDTASDPQIGTVYLISPDSF